MLGKIFSRKSDHPMADVKSAQALLADLPRNDALKSVMELTDWIESVADKEDFKPLDQLAVVGLLDETAQPHLKKLACEYFTLPDMHAFQGNRLCIVLGNFFNQAARAYGLLFARLSRDETKLPLLASRAVRAMAEQIKYSAVRYQEHNEALWRNLAQIYQHAEQHQYLDVPVSLYPAETATVKREAGKLLAWYACGIGSWVPRSMHLGERLIDRYADAISIQGELTDQAFCSFELSGERAPVRIYKDAVMHPLIRYVSLPGIQSKLAAILAILEKNIIPDELHFNCDYKPEWVQDAAQHVMRYVVSPPQRQGKRRELRAEIAVVAGYESVFLCVAGEGSGEPMHMVLENASPGGFLAQASGKGIDNLRIGHVLGLQTAPRIGVSIVRRLLRGTDGLLHVGAEILTNHASMVSLRAGEGDIQHALWLGAAEGMATLLMPVDIFSMQRSLKTSMDGKSYLLIPSRLIEAGIDFDLASFRMIEREEE
jgi:hypothetical protein